MNTEKIQLTLSDLQIAQITETTVIDRKKLGFACYFKSGKVSIFSNCHNLKSAYADQKNNPSLKGASVFDFYGFCYLVVCPLVICLDERGNIIDVEQLLIIN